MSRKKSAKPQELLTRIIRTRVTEATFKHLDKIHKQSDCGSIAEVVRMVLSNRKIKLFHIDASMNAPMEELALIRKELRAIGVNINQITRSFNQDKTETKRAFYITKVAGLYKEVDAKMDRLLILISQLAEKWLQKS